jgi:hypothetical protein
VEKATLSEREPPSGGRATRRTRTRVELGVANVRRAPRSARLGEDDAVESSKARRARAAIAPLFLFTLLAACGELESPVPPARVVVTTPPVGTPPAAGSATPPAADGAAPAMTRVLFRGTPPRWSWDGGEGRSTFRGWAEFIGVDEEKHTAYVVFYGAGHEAGELRTIDLSAGTDRASPMPDTAASPAAQAKSAASIAEIVGSTHADRTEQDHLRSLHIAVATSTIVFGNGHDGLVIASRRGEGGRPFAANLSAAYHPIFSPDERHLAFTGCTQRGLVPKGAVHRCVYELYLSEAPFEKVRAIDAALSPTPPVFSPDGRYVYTVSRDDDHAGRVEDADHGGCLVRVDVESGEAARIHCTSELRGVGFAEASDGETGVVFGLVRDAAKSETFVRALSLPDGDEQRAITIPYAASLEIGSGVSTGGLMISEGAGSVMVVDLKRGISGRTPISTDKRILGFGPWKNGHSVYLLGASAGAESPTFEIMEFDARAVLPKAADGQPAPAEPAPDADLPYY